MDVDYTDSTYVYHEDEDFKAEIEEAFTEVPGAEKIVFMHIELYNKSKSSFKKVLEVFEKFKEKCKAEGLEYVHAYTSNFRFAKFLGPHTIIKDFYKDGTRYGVFAWELV